MKYSEQGKLSSGWVRKKEDDMVFIPYPQQQEVTHLGDNYYSMYNAEKYIAIFKKNTSEFQLIHVIFLD